MIYIDVDKFAEKICNFQQIDEDTTNKMIFLLRKQPTADVEEVVRCGKCKHGEKYVIDNVTSLYKCYRLGISGFIEDFHCGYGERRKINEKKM